MKNILTLVQLAIALSLSLLTPTKGISQAKTALKPDPIALIDSVIHICDAANFWGACEIGRARGEVNIGF